MDTTQYNPTSWLVDLKGCWLAVGGSVLLEYFLSAVFTLSIYTSYAVVLTGCLLLH